MNKLKIWFLGVMVLAACKTQKIEPIKISYTASELNGSFKNQGEQEDYWAKKIFDQQYKKGSYSKYKGEIKLIDENHIRYGETIVEVAEYKPELKSIFTTGLLYPEIIFPGDLKISNIEVVTFLSDTYKVKRFKFWVFHKSFGDSAKWFMNPSVYFMELINTKASKKTSIGDFIKGAELTFIKDGYVVI